MPAVSSNVVDELKASLSASTLVLTPDSENYEEGIKRWAASSEKPAAIVVFPTSANDVSKIVLFSIANSLKIAICGGGHSTGGHSSTDGGISIDLSKMRGCTVDIEKKTVSVQGGALWRDVDKALGEYGLATVGGTVNHTGVGGLTLGGGYGWLTPQYGLTIDNLLSVELVLANSLIVTASSTHNSDLFWAARGAGQGFGVATNFVFQAYEQKNAAWGGMMVFPPTQLKAVFEASNHFTESCTGKSAHAVAYASPPPAFQPCIAVILFYDGLEEEARRFYEPLLSLQPLVDMTSAMPYDKVNGMVNDLNPFGLRRSMKGSACLTPIDPLLAEIVFQDFLKFHNEVPDAGASIIMFECISPRKLIQVSQTETAFANRGAYFNVLFSTTWTQKENDSVCREWTRTMATKTNEFLQSSMARGTDNVTKSGVGQYANYDSVSETGQVLFGVNFPRLVELKKRYDPGNIFGRGMNLL